MNDVKLLQALTAALWSADPSGAPCGLGQNI